MAALLMISTALSGCTQAEEAEVQRPNTNTVEAKELSTEDNKKPLLRDNQSLYKKQVDNSVVTMYLTVRRGSEAEGTNYKWQDVNEHSVYFYEEEGIDRYMVDAILQVGDENGPLASEYGHNAKIPNATVAIRGQSSSRNPVKSYKVSIKDGKGSWRDQTTINLNKHVGDSLRFRNKLCYDLMEELPGMMSLQTQFVHLYVKDETVKGESKFVDYGLYTQVEQPNKTFLETHGLDKFGHLYKINHFEFQRYEDIIKLKDDETYNEEAFESLVETKGNDDHTKLINMLEDLNDYNIPIETVFEKWFEEDNFFSWLAFHILTGNRDTQSRNMLLYSPLNVDTFYFISWDNDGAFKRTEDELLQREKESSWEYGVANYWPNVLIKRVLKSEEYVKKLDSKIEEYKAFLSPEKLKQKIDEYEDVTTLYRSRFPDKASVPLNMEQYKKVIELLPSEVEKNYKLYKESLKDPMPFFMDTPKLVDGEMHYEWKVSYDFNQEDIKYTFELAEDYTFEDPIVKEENLTVPLAKSYRLTPGKYFIRVKATNASGRSQYAFDYYMSSRSTKEFGVKCFYVLQDGSIQEEVYEE